MATQSKNNFITVNLRSSEGYVSLIGFIPNSRCAIIFSLCCLISSVFLTVVNSLPSASNNSEEIIERPVVEYTSDNFRDPSHPQISFAQEEQIIIVEETRPKPSEVYTLTIQGVIWNPDNPVVIINNQVLKKGAVLLMSKAGAVAEKITIVDIGKDGVIVEYLGESEKLFFPASLELSK